MTDLALFDTGVEERELIPIDRAADVLVGVDERGLR